MAEASPFKHGEADESAGFLLWKITALWQQKLAHVLHTFGLTQTQYAIMASLRWFEESHEPTTQMHIAEHAKIDKMTLSKAIRKLEIQGLVTRQPSAVDSRAIEVQFTAQGRTVVEQAIVAIENADEAFFAALTWEELKQYKYLTRVVIAKNASLSSG